MTRSVLVVDDEPPARNRLRRLLADMEDLELVGEAANGRQCIEQVQRLQPDLVLLDISMPGPGGIWVAEQLAQMEHPPAVIFCTAFDEHALAAFRACAVDYLLKPVRADVLAAALGRARRLNRWQWQSLRRPVPGLSVHSHSGTRLLPLQRIAAVVADARCVWVHHDDGKTMVDMSLHSLEQRYEGLLVRVHRKALANRTRMAGLERRGRAHLLVLRGLELRVPVGRRRLASVRRMMDEMMEP